MIEIQDEAQRLAGRVMIVTGAGRGLGAAYAKLAASHGAKVVVNDLTDSGGSPAEAVVDEIRAAGGTAVIDTHDVADFAGAEAMIQRAITEFGDLDVLVNNAGILRDRMVVNMSEQEWDEVIRVHLRGHFCPAKHAVTYWRDRAKSAGKRDAVIIGTSSIAGLHGNVGQLNYATAKSGIGTMAHVLHLEANERLGVRSYAIAPSGRTQLTTNSPGAAAVVAKPAQGFDFYDPANVAPFVIWLSAEGCPAPSGQVFGVEGDLIRRYDSWSVGTTIYNNESPWTLRDLDARAEELMVGHARAFTPVTEVMRMP